MAAVPEEQEDSTGGVFRPTLTAVAISFPLPMLPLAIGVIIFIGIHLVPGVPIVRQRLVERLGEGAYKGVFSCVALAGLLLIIIGKARADVVPLWQPPDWGRTAALAITSVAFILLAAAYLPSNIKRFTAHPMLWGVSAWAAAHLLTNGDLASMLLFGSLGAFALVAMWSANRRGAAVASVRQPLLKDGVAVAAGLVAYGIFLALHPYLFGVAVIS